MDRWILTEEIKNYDFDNYANLIIGEKYSCFIDNPKGFDTSRLKTLFRNYDILSCFKINDIVHILVKSEHRTDFFNLRCRIIVENGDSINVYDTKFYFKVSTILDNETHTFNGIITL
jgi:hypothetical protein